MRGKESGGFIKVIRMSSSFLFNILTHSTLFTLKKRNKNQMTEPIFRETHKPGGWGLLLFTFSEKKGRVSEIGTVPADLFSFHAAISVKEIGPGIPIATGLQSPKLLLAKPLP